MPGEITFMERAIAGVSRVLGIGGKVGKEAKTIRIVEEGSKIAREGGKAAKVVSDGARSLKYGAIGGLTTFFGFEWLTNGGLVQSVGGTLGISNTAASALVIVVSLSVVGVVIYGLFKHMTKGTGGTRSRGGK